MHLHPVALSVCLLVSFFAGIAVGADLIRRRRAIETAAGRASWDRVGPRVIDGGKTERQATKLYSKEIA